MTSWSAAAQAEDYRSTFQSLSAAHGDAVVIVRFVMSVTASGKEDRIEDRAQAFVVSADGLILLPDRAVSVDFGALNPSANSSTAPVATSREFRVRLANADDWLDADLVTRDSQLGLAWLRIRKPPGVLDYINLDDGELAQSGMPFFTLLRASDDRGSSILIRKGLIVGKTVVPRSLFLVDGVPGMAFLSDGKPIGFVDFDFSRLMRARNAGSGLGLDTADAVLQMTPIAKVAAATKLALSLPVVQQSK